MQIAFAENVLSVVVDSPSGMVVVERPRQRVQAGVVRSGRNAQVNPGAGLAVDGPGGLAIDLLTQVLVLKVRQVEVVADARPGRGRGCQPRTAGTWGQRSGR